MDVLFLPKYGELAASARLRFLQYLPYLSRHGVRCTVSPLFSDRYLAARFESGKAPAGEVARALWRRTRAILTARRHDLVLLHYEAFPYLPGLLERCLSLSGAPYLLDYDDAIFHNYDQGPLRRLLLGGKIPGIMARSQGVLCGSRYLCRYAQAHHPNVAFLPTVIDLARYPAARPPRPPGPLTIGWIGSPSTAQYLLPLAPALSAFCRQAQARVRLVGSGPIRLPGVPVEVRPFQTDTEVAELCQMDIGIMPLPDTPWARGKCGFKLIQYMACSLPVLASPVGANLDIVRESENGLLCATEADWLAGLRRLAGDPDLRARLGRAGRRFVEQEFCLAVTAPRLLGLLQATLDRVRAAPRRPPRAGGPTRAAGWCAPG
jgi:glycosyltransferase involved in cell wall biosynthesis